ncbi:hypothetical protein HEP84_49125 [Streptomyces sp. RLB1-33]|nr:hypothetical protein [Streptomyces sp. RLB1-33]QIY75787.1 hypothetical protein HEP84_49125 [Streptomyces sp. RLB1-33]
MPPAGNGVSGDLGREVPPVELGRPSESVVVQVAEFDHVGSAPVRGTLVRVDGADAQRLLPVFGSMGVREYVVEAADDDACDERGSARLDARWAAVSATPPPPVAGTAYRAGWMP